MNRVESEPEYIKNHLTDIPPEGCRFNVGDVVTFTNEFGVSFKGYRVIGFSKDPTDRYIHLNGNSPYWFGVRPGMIMLEQHDPAEALNVDTISHWL